ncbi:unnamed protein product [Brassicogethes aeneus]|uniref:Uncharacterized protein n=1 Tax=Brassicogethes aeneus TaxID=1431903 RepID=A0A9P0BCX6_BRAAE|nr:unnamed protein product [Brassicogethes aeneus]
MSKNNEEERRTKFWDKLELKLGAFMPLHIRNIFKYNSLDNPRSSRFIEEGTISDIEEFLRTTMTKLLENIEDKDNYFGVQHQQPENFKFNHGDKFLLITLAEHVRSKPPIITVAKVQKITYRKKTQLEFCAFEEIRKLKNALSSTSNKKRKHYKDDTLSEKTYRRMMGMEVSIEVTKKTNNKNDRMNEVV